MNNNLLTISFVGVFKTPQTMIQPLNAKFCREVFHNPGNTVSGFSPNGFVVKHRTLPAPSISITPEKLIVMATSLNDLFEYINSLRAQIPEYEFAAYGLNRDIESLGICQNEDIGDWMCRHFIKQQYYYGNRVNRTSKLNFLFDINDNELVNIDMEPRVGIRNGLFMSINHHNNYQMKGLPTQNKLNNLYYDSNEKVNRVINELLK